VLIGAKGTGKGTLARCLGPIFGVHAFQVTSREEVSSRAIPHPIAAESPTKECLRVPWCVVEHRGNLPIFSVCSSTELLQDLCVFCNDPGFFRIGHSARRIFCCHVTQ
jgi:hypothetical protein